VGREVITSRPFLSINLYKIYKSAGYQTVDIVQMICYTWRNSGSGSVAVAGGANNDGSSNFLEEHYYA
jgi:hypothetical protein